MSRQRMELSKNNKYFIEKNRRYELMYFCRQYDSYKKELLNISYYPSSNAMVKEKFATLSYTNPTEDIALRKLLLKSYIDLIEETAVEADSQISRWILLGVTKHISFEELTFRYSIPCGKDMYYDRFHKFWWILDKKRL